MKSYDIAFEDEVVYREAVVPVRVRADVELPTPSTPEDPGSAGTVQIFTVTRTDTGVEVKDQVRLVELEDRAIQMARALQEAEMGGVPDEWGPGWEGRELERLVALFKTLDLGEQDLDDEVHDTKAAEAANINNAGIEAQLKYLHEQLGYEETVQLLEEYAGDDRG